MTAERAARISTKLMLMGDIYGATHWDFISESIAQKEKEAEATALAHQWGLDSIAIIEPLDLSGR